MQFKKCLGITLYTGTNFQIKERFNRRMLIGKIKFSKLSLTDAQEQITKMVLTSNGCKQVVVANAYSVVLTHKNSEFSEVCEQADLVFADGMPIVWATAILGDRVPERVAGPDFMWLFSAKCLEHSFRVFLFGSREPYLSSLKKNMEKSFPGIKIVGTLSPPFGEWCEEETGKMISVINSAKPDILWVGVSTPKQDIWVHRNKVKLKAKVAIGVGAAFDFHSGRVKRAPVWMQKWGIEWLFRFLSEPRRMWRRYAIGNIQFLGIVLIQILKKMKSKR